MYYFMLFRIISYGNCFYFALGKNIFILFHAKNTPLSVLVLFIGYNTSRKVDH